MSDYRLMEARRQAALRQNPFHVWDLPDGTKWIECYRHGNNFLLRFPGFADFSIPNNGVAATCWPVPGLDAATRDHLFRNQVQPLMWNRQAKPVFHGSCAEVGDGAVAFLGPSGTGKSTLAALFSVNGYSFLTDDVLLIKPTSSGPFVLPHDAAIRLWESSREGVLGHHKAVAPAVSFTKKSRLLAASTLPYCNEPRPLLGAFFLENEGLDRISIRLLKGSLAHIAWVRCSFILDVEDHESLSANFHRVVDLVSALPTFALDFPRDFRALDEVREAIIDQVEHNGVAS